ncbi:cell wall-binding repeat-containing protein [Faecalimicrobium sp. JNUCC 81]
MMKKKSMAIAMAAVTVASSVAPAFAAEYKVIEKDIFTKSEKSKLISEIKRLSKIVFSDGDKKAGENVYSVKIGAKEYDLETDVQEIVDAITDAKKELVVSILDEGHKVLKDGTIISEEKEKYSNLSELVELVTEAKKVVKVADSKVDAKREGDIVTITVTDKADAKKVKTVTVKKGQNKINLEKPVAADGKTEALTYATFDRFAEADAADIVTGDANKVVAKVTVKDAIAETAKIADLFDGHRLTAQGNVVRNGLEETVPGTKDVVAVAQDPTTKLYQVKVRYNDEKGTLREVKVTNKTKKEMDSLATALNGDAKIATVAGNTRYSTAVEIAKQNNKDNIVLVNSSALVDGLAATPLAKAAEASILLTDKGSLPQATLDQIKEMIEAGKTPKVYLVGGESVISKSIETELSKLMDKDNVTRISGENRHETSLAVAKYIFDAKGLNKGSVDRTFVVGATGEADAMSIAAHAADRTAPIIVNGFNGFSQDALDFVKNTNIDIIGGETAVPADLEKKLVELDSDEEVVRTKGTNRFETNANVVKTYYGKGINNLYIAKDGMAKKDQLVDALAAGPLAAGKGPILLATDKLSAAQETVVEENVRFGAKVTQLGNGVKLSLVEKLAKTLGL